MEPTADPGSSATDDGAGGTGASGQVLVAGHLVVEPSERDGYLDGCRAVVEQARRAPGCLDFAITADLLDPARIDIFERWESRAAVDAFRGSGPSDEQSGAVVSGSVAEFDVAGTRTLM